MAPEPVYTPRRISLAPVGKRTLFLESSPRGLVAIPSTLSQLQTSVGPVVQLYSWRKEFKSCGENKYLISFLSGFSLLTSEILSAWAGDRRLGQYLKLSGKKKTSSGLVDAPPRAFRRIYVSYLAFDLPLLYSPRMP